MSRVVKNTNVTSINGISSKNSFTPLAAICTAAVAGIAAYAIRDLITSEVKLSKTKIQASTQSFLKSTQECRKEMTSLFTNDVKFSDNASESSFENYKQTLLQSLTNSSYYIQESTTIRTDLNELISAINLKELRSKSDSLIAKIEKQHTQIIGNELNDKIKIASSEIGFNEIKVYNREANCTIICAENKAGQALVHEVRIDNKTNQVNHEYEVVGVKDDTCDLIANNFQKILKQKGVSFSNNTKRPTGGNAVLALSKEIEKNIKQKKNAQLQRTRKLNQHKMLNNIK